MRMLGKKRLLATDEADTGLLSIPFGRLPPFDDPAETRHRTKDLASIIVCFLI